MPNRLVSETSPYLLQHAHNPVDWFPWGDEALNIAMREDKPILLSIGYSACHWCHVMERECFENPSIARLMNDNFVNIKVDREERPDLDAIHMEAVQAIAGSGGWPLTVFLTPQRRPFYGGTYFPPEDRPGLPGFPRVLQTVAQAYRARRSDIESAADQIVAHLNRSLEVGHPVEPLTTNALGSAYIIVKSTFDTQNGGFGSAPKFPQPMVLEFLLRYHHRTGDKEALSMVEHSLERMAKGGIYDQIGGGFHRYCVDNSWLVPHFEKMLYDNALLSLLYLHAYQVTGKQFCRRIVEETLDYVLREMRHEKGGFYSTQDADSEGAEGKYYVWTPNAVIGVLGLGDAELIGRYFGITESGNFEGGNILSQVIDTETLALQLGIALEELQSRIARAKASMLERRAGRIPPQRDEKILADWNGLMLTSIAEAALVLRRDDYMEAAISNATFLMQSLYDGEFLKHSYKDGQARINGYLLDYALLCKGLLSLYEATFQARWRQAAEDLAQAMVEQFWDESHGCFYDTSSAHETLVGRPRNIHDNALPSGSAAAASVLLHLARLTDNKVYERMASYTIRSVQELMVRYPSGFGHWLCALDFYLSRPTEIVVVGKPENPATQSLVNVIKQRYMPNIVLAGRIPNYKADIANVPLLKERDMIDNKPTAYVCEDYACQSPVTDPNVLASILGEK